MRRRRLSYPKITPAEASVIAQRWSARPPPAPPRPEHIPLWVTIIGLALCTIRDVAVPLFFLWLGFSVVRAIGVVY